MDLALYEKSPSGKLVDGGGYRAFVPNPLPPRLAWDDRLVGLVSRADIALGTIAGIGENLPNPHLLIYPFVRREAVLSSRIEGTQSSLTDLLVYEATAVEKREDVREVQNYVHALEFGLRRLDEIPLGRQLFRELHGVLMEGVRGGQAAPGQFRTFQNWIGPPGGRFEDALFVPPPPPQMLAGLMELETFLNGDSALPALVQLALAHYQFETLHPFIDGNGRLGRLLVSLFLCRRGILKKPLLYLSAYFERNRDEYYRLLRAVSQRGEWREWIEFFLQGVIDQAHDAAARSRRLVALHDRYRDLAVARRLTPSATQLLDRLFTRPVLGVRGAQELLGISFPGAQKAVDALVKEGVLAETTGGRRNRTWAAREIMVVLEEGLPPSRSATA
jgi:Fic family protein